jgi:hypothetical protein
MKTNSKRESLKFGGMVTAANDASGGRGVKGIVWLAVNVRLIESEAPQHLESFKEGLQLDENQPGVSLELRSR